MKTNFAACMAVVEKWEGGNDDDPQDPGGRTSRGVIQSEYNRYRRSRNLLIRDVWKMDNAERDDIFRSGYWTKVQGDNLPAGFDLTTFDGAINSGPAQGVKWLQRALGVAADGDLGAGTLSAAILAAAVPDRAVHIIQDDCANRAGFLRSLRTFKRFGKGWLNRVADVEARAVAMVAALGRPVAKTAADHANDAAMASTTSKKTATGVATTAVGSGAVGTESSVADHANAVASHPWVFFAAAAVLLIIALVGVHFSRFHAARAAAYRQVASEAKGQPA